MHTAWESRSSKLLCIRKTMTYWPSQKSTVMSYVTYATINGYKIFRRNGQGGEAVEWPCMSGDVLIVLSFIMMTVLSIYGEPTRDDAMLDLLFVTRTTCGWCNDWGALLGRVVIKWQEYTVIEVKRRAGRTAAFWQADFGLFWKLVNGVPWKAVLRGQGV